MKASTIIKEYTTIRGKQSDKCLQEAYRLQHLKHHTAHTPPVNRLRPPFTTAKLERVSKQTKSGNVAGPDKIDPYLLKHQLTSATPKLKKILSHSWMDGELVQTIPKVLNYDPFRKEEKKLAHECNYYPVSLTSNTVKLIQITQSRTICHDENQILSPWQAVLCKPCSTTDQCLRFSKSILWQGVGIT